MNGNGMDNGAMEWIMDGILRNTPQKTSGLIIVYG